MWGKGWENVGIIYGLGGGKMWGKGWENVGIYPCNRLIDIIVTAF